MFRKIITSALLFSALVIIMLSCSLTASAGSNTTSYHKSYKRTATLFIKNPFLAPGKYHSKSLQKYQQNTSPILKGIIQTTKESAAIIEISGSSNFYKLHQFIEQYQITKITRNSVHLLKDNKLLILTLKD